MALFRAIASTLVHKIQQAIDRGVVPDRAEVARRLGLTRARVTSPLTVCERTRAAGLVNRIRAGPIQAGVWQARATCAIARWLQCARSPTA